MTKPISFETPVFMQAKATAKSAVLSPNIQKLTQEQRKTLLAILKNDEKKMLHYQNKLGEHWENHLKGIELTLHGDGTRNRTKSLAATTSRIIKNIFGRPSSSQIKKAINQAKDDFTPRIQTFSLTTTAQLIKETRGKKSNEALSHLVHRDAGNEQSPGWKDKLSINGNKVPPIIRPKTAPKDPLELLPPELKNFMDSNESLMQAAAVLFTQNIGVGPLELLKKIEPDQIAEDEKFHYRDPQIYPSFSFYKSASGDVLLEVTSTIKKCKLEGSDLIETDVQLIEITQKINLSKPDAKVLMVVRN